MLRPVCCDLLLIKQQVRGIAVSDPSFHVDLDAKPVAARAARRFVAEHVGEAGEDGSLALLTSEVVTNGVLHARTHLRLGVTTGADHILVTCGDDDTSGSLVIPPPNNRRPTGRGLMLVDTLASEWGVETRDTGKTVWFTLPRSSAPSGGDGT